MTERGRYVSRSVVIAVLGLCLVTASVLGTTTAVAHASHEESVRVELQADGDATVTLVVTQPVADESERAAFDQLNATSMAERFETRMQQVAERTAAETGRTMTVSDVETTVETTDETGVVELSVTWTNLAAVEDDRLTVAEPFASGFEPDRPLVLTAPDGYTIDSATVTPVQNDGTAARWSVGTDLSGFSTVVTADASSSGDALPTGLVPGLAVLLGSGLLARVFGRR